MKKYFAQIIGSLLLSLPLLAQQAKVESAIRVFPYEQKETAQDAINSMYTWAKSDWSHFVGLLNDDSLKLKASYALAAFVNNASLDPSHKKQAATALSKAYKAATTPYAKEIVIKYLGLAGDDAAIKVLNTLLKQDAYVGSAARALATMRSEKSIAVLDRALKNATSSSAPTISAAIAHAKMVLPKIEGSKEINFTSSKTYAQQLLDVQVEVEKSTNYLQQKNGLFKAGRIPLIGSLLFVGGFLQDSLLKTEAALIVTRLALSNSELKGPAVRNILEAALPLIDGEDSLILSTSLAKHLKKMPYDYGYEFLFNKENLVGWKALVKNPIERNKMSDAELQILQKNADEKTKGDWVVKDGLLVFTGHGDNLVTEKKYGDIELFVDWKITEKGDAGIYLRGTPQVQIWDTSRREVGAQVGSGGLYNNRKNKSTPLVVADNKIGEWNTFHIVMRGEKVTVYLNGILVTDNITLENYWDKALPIFTKEQIELQAHGTYVAYRNIYLRELPTGSAATLSEEESKQGFVTLFDGTNINQWTGNTAGYTLRDGYIEVNPEARGGGNLYTKEEFSDFVYRFEFQLTPGANNGIGIRAPLEGDAAYVGMEIQVLDNDAPMYKNLQPYQFHGSVYGVVPAKRGDFAKPTGQWNQEEIEIKGSKIKVTLNGNVLVESDLKEATKNGTLDHNQHPGLNRTTGHIGFLGHGDVVRFKNMRIKKL